MIDIAKIRELKNSNDIQKQLEKDFAELDNAIKTRTKEFEQLVDNSLIEAAKANKWHVDIKFNIISLENLNAFINILTMYKKDYKCYIQSVDDILEQKFCYESQLYNRVLYFMCDFLNIIFKQCSDETVIKLYKDREAFKFNYKKHTNLATDSITVRFDFSEE